ncbi:MAG: sigma-70 family RNA polymerase sigma factor, partial [bacterium]
EKRYADLFGDEINVALSKLSYDFRAVVILCDIEGFSYKEIAAIIGTPIGTVMSRLSRARQQLQKYLREYARREGFVKNPK